MNKDTKVNPVSINILGKDYRVACSEEEQETLIRSAHDLDEQMREIRDSGTVNGTDRIAVMAALNLTHELHMVEQRLSDKPSDKPTNKPTDKLSARLANLRHKIENVLENH